MKTDGVMGEHNDKELFAFQIDRRSLPAVIKQTLISYSHPVLWSSTSANVMFAYCILQGVWKSLLLPWENCHFKLSTVLYTKYTKH